MQTYRIRISGTVQGVGFRPFIYNLARRFSLRGEVGNDSLGVVITCNTSKEILSQFISRIENEAPPLSRIDRIMVTEILPCSFEDFRIVQSRSQNVATTLIPPDVGICKACEKELFDPSDRRYLHPFITCTDCGVRYTIIEKLPYDRQNTSMRRFTMCKACAAEYSDPTNRRYHAQPIGCHECGPKLSMPVEEATELLRRGKIVAVKGVGGYHLICDAKNDAALKRLRERKQRPAKPFAVMVANIEEAKKVAEINETEAALLTSPQRPIVLLQAKPNDLSKEIAPGISRIGIFLAYTPLHLLLLKAFGGAVIATSANFSDEPIATDTASIQRLSGIYDVLLDHDREIVNGCDDSVAMVVKGQIVMLRRARGYAPASVKLPFRLQKKILAVGGNQKSSVAIAFENEAILSPHIGDLESIESVAYFQRNIESLMRIYDFTPDLVVHDKHPNYESTRYAKSRFPKTVAIQHHYAHILGVMAERNITEPVLGVAFDGTGYGDDGKLWGGEFLLCDREGYMRVAHFRYFKLPGGAKAIKEPRRVALSLLFERYGKEALEMDHPTVQSFSETERNTLYIAWEKGLNAPESSSCGRLFDAVASLTDICHIMSFEGESGMRLEERYDPSVTESYPIVLYDDEIDFLPMIEEIVHESDPRIAVSKFFNTLAEIILMISSEYDLPLLLSGGVFQNRVLLELILERIPDAIIPGEIPPNDGGIALGQVYGATLF